MTKEICFECGSPKGEHTELAAQNAATVIMMKHVADSLPKDYAETLNQILIDWRTHTLPVCDPSAIT